MIGPRPRSTTSRPSHDARIDVLFAGPSDLSIALTNGAELDPHSPSRGGARPRHRGGHKAGKVAGLYCANAERPSPAPSAHPFLAVGKRSRLPAAGAAAQLKT